MKKALLTLAAVAVLASLLLPISPAVGVASPPLLTNSLSITGTPVQSSGTFGPEIKVNYTDNYAGTLPGPVTIFTLVVRNSLGQTVGFGVSTASPTTGQITSILIPIPAEPSGKYTGIIFAATVGGVPLSVETSVSINL